MTLTPQNIAEICDGIVNARTIEQPERLALIEEIERNGLTPSILARLTALFAAEETAANDGIATLDQMAASLQGQLDAESARIAPELQNRSASFAQGAKTIAAESKQEVDAIDREVTSMVEGAVANDDAASADAIREALKQPKK